MRFTQKAQVILLSTRLEADRLQHRHIGTAHLLMALLQADGPIGNILRLFALQLPDVQEIAQQLYIAQSYPATTTSELALDLKIVLSAAALDAHTTGKESISSDNLFLTLMSQNTCHAIDILTTLNVNPTSLRSEFLLGRGGGPPSVRQPRWKPHPFGYSLRFPAALPERLSANAQHALALAKDVARQYGHPVITSAHLLIGLMEAEGQARRVLIYLGLNSTPIREMLRQQYTSDRIWDGNSLEMSPDLEEVFVLATHEGRPGETAIGTGHLLLGITLQPKSAALDILKAFNISESRIQGQIIRKLVSE